MLGQIRYPIRDDAQDGDRYRPVGVRKILIATVWAKILVAALFVSPATGHGRRRGAWIPSLPFIATHLDAVVTGRCFVVTGACSLAREPAAH